MHNFNLVMVLLKAVGIVNCLQAESSRRENVLHYTYVHAYITITYYSVHLLQYRLLLSYWELEPHLMEVRAVGC